MRAASTSLSLPSTFSLKPLFSQAVAKPACACSNRFQQQQQQIALLCINLCKAHAAHAYMAQQLLQRPLASVYRLQSNLPNSKWRPALFWGSSL